MIHIPQCLHCRGAGHGDPYRRPPEAVLRDVIEGYVSVEVARADYGVVCTLATHGVDLEGTRRLRDLR